MASAASPTYESLVRQLSNKQYAPVYLLHGEEGYYIDALIKEFEKIVPADEKDFNEYTIYAPQVDMGEVMNICMRVPMMADHQVVILKEAQAHTSRPDSTNFIIMHRVRCQQRYWLSAAAELLPKAKNSLPQSKPMVSSSSQRD